MERKSFIDVHPELIDEWEWSKNKEIADPSEISYAAEKKVWWKCRSCGYEWVATIYNRHIGSGCPYCAKNVVWTGHNDLETLYPDLLRDWNYSKNKDLNPKNISVNSPKKAWWICHTCGYEWSATIGSRAKGGNGCPYCSGRAVWVGHNDLATTNPGVASEWNYKMNGDLLPTMFTAGSKKKVWWKCSDCGHEWITSIGARKNGAGCRKCGVKKAAISMRKTSLQNGKNSLASVNPELAKEWHTNKNNLTPADVPPNTRQKIWWICPKCGYEYQASVACRNSGKTGCPVCANQKFCSGINDLQTLYPDIASEWSDKNNVSPDKVLAGGHTKYYFKCRRCGFEWKASVKNRIIGNGCPNCAHSLHTSVPEQVIYYCVKKAFSTARNSYKPEWLDGKEIDIYIPSLDVGIEFDGGAWHQDTTKDINKSLIVKEHGVSLIRIRDPRCPEIKDGSIQIVLDSARSNQSHLKKAIKQLFAILNEKFNAKAELLCDIDEAFAVILSKARTKTIDNSLSSDYPALIEEWHEEKNKGLDPSKISKKSNIIVWWKCKTCGYEWKTSVQNRTSNHGCPFCANEVVWAGHNDVVTVRPDLLDEWDFEKNNILPSEVTPKSHKSIYWKCSKCNHSWRAPLYNRASGHGCPICGRKIAAEKSAKTVINIDTGEKFKSARNAAEVSGINYSSITSACRGEIKTAGGFHWRYL